MMTGEEQQTGGLQLDLSVYPSQPKRVSQACDFCRKKRVCYILVFDLQPSIRIDDVIYQ